MKLVKNAHSIQSISALMLALGLVIPTVNASYNMPMDANDPTIFDLELSWRSSAHDVNLTGDTDPEGLGSALYDPSTNELSFSSFYMGLTGSPTMAHFHLGEPGVDGGVVQTICGQPEPTLLGACPEGDMGELDGVWDVPEDQVDNLLAGNIYLNIHTPANAGGEIRAQLIPDSDM